MDTATAVKPVMVTLGVTVAERFKRLAALDLTNVRRKLMEPYPEGKGWNEAQALEAEKWYKRYLAIIIKYPDATQHVPNGPIDFFWHQHILDTMAYGPDCEHVLGYFLHHYPYFGLNGDAVERDDCFNQTNELYRKEFGEDCTQMGAFDQPFGQSEVASKCGQKGCGQGCSKKRGVGKITTGQKVGGCCHTGGTGRKKRPMGLVSLVASSCNHGGGGTGCGQGCGGHK